MADNAAPANAADGSTSSSGGSQFVVEGSDPEVVETSDFFNVHRKGVRKFITSAAAFESWKSSTSRTALSEFVHQLAEALTAHSQTAGEGAGKPPPPPAPSARVQELLTLLANHSALVDSTPPLPQQTRFGNLAYRDWHAKQCRDVAKHYATNHAALSQATREELAAYYSNSFGDHTRLDYGTGHEVSFVTWLLALERSELLVAADDRLAVAELVLPKYFDLVRKLVATYNLEPAGSHGVWSLDDYQCLPFLLGAAQLLPAPGAVSPRTALFRPSGIPVVQIGGDGKMSAGAIGGGNGDAAVVAAWGTHNMFFTAVQFVRTMKKGAGFDETSPMLYQLMTRLQWQPLFAGLVRLWHGEVLDKFPVAQHILFGEIFSASWRTADVIAAEASAKPAAPVSLFDRLRMERAASAGGAGGNMLQKYFFLQPVNASDIPAGLKGEERQRAAASVDPAVARALVKTNAHLAPDGNGIELFGWSMRSGSGPLATTAAIDEISAAAEGVPAPEMIFDKNFVELSFNRSATTIRFEIVGAMLGCTLRAHQRPSTGGGSVSSESSQVVPPEQENVSVKKPFPFYSVIHPPSIVEHQLAEAWRQRSHKLTASGQKIAFPVFSHDWTYSSVYQGSIFRGKNVEAQITPQQASEGIDYDLLKQREPILWYKSVTLFEAELDDAGHSSLEVKIRVMPSCFFVLLRLFMRVDEVSLRLYDTRYFHRFGSNKVLVETKTSDSTFARLAEMGKSTRACDYREPHKFEQLLQPRQELTEEFLLDNE